MKILKSFIKAVVAILVVNILFWVLVVFDMNPWYENGCIIKAGPIAMVFGHGKWSTEQTKVEHITYVDGKYIPTLQLVEQLHRDGATYIWGTWCYANDLDGVIKIDKIFGEKYYWPDYVSRPGKGKTLAVWVGVWFVRLNFGKPNVLDTTRFDFTKGIRMGFETPSWVWPTSDSLYHMQFEDKAVLANEVNRMYGFQPDSLQLESDYYHIMRMTREELVMIQNHEMPDDNKFLFLYGECWTRGMKIPLLVSISPAYPEKIGL